MHRTAAIALTALIVVQSFCGIAQADEAPAPQQRAMPNATFSSREDFYPPQAKRSGLEGVVSVAVSLDAKGRSAARITTDTSSASASSSPPAATCPTFNGETRR